MTLTLKINLDCIQINPHTKFCDPNYNTYEDMNYCPVTFGWRR